MTAVKAHSHAWMMVVMVSGMASSYQLLVRINFFFLPKTASEVSGNVEHETTLYSHHRPCDKQDI